MEPFQLVSRAHARKKQRMGGNSSKPGDDGTLASLGFDEVDAEDENGEAGLIFNADGTIVLAPDGDVDLERGASNDDDDDDKDDATAAAGAKKEETSTQLLAETTTTTTTRVPDDIDTLETEREQASIICLLYTSPSPRD